MAIDKVHNFSVSVAGVHVPICGDFLLPIFLFVHFSEESRSTYTLSKSERTTVVWKLEERKFIYMNDNNIMTDALQGT